MTEDMCYILTSLFTRSEQSVECQKISNLKFEAGFQKKLQNYERIPEKICGNLMKTPTEIHSKIQNPNPR